MADFYLVPQGTDYVIICDRLWQNQALVGKNEIRDFDVIL